MDLSIIIVAYNVKDLVEECLNKVKGSRDSLKKEVIFVDNGSADGTVEMVAEKFPEVSVIKAGRNLGFIGANNLGYLHAKGDYLLMLNSDAFIGENVLQKAFDFMETHPDSGVVGARLIGRDGKLQPSARDFYTPWREFTISLGLAAYFPRSFLFKGIDNLECDHSSVRLTDWVPGCFLMVRKKLADEFGYLLRKDFFMYCDDIDLCLRLKRKKWNTYFYPEDVIHLGGENSKRLTEVTPGGAQIDKYNIESKYIYYRKNYNVFYVLETFIFILLLDVSQIMKKLIFPNKKIMISACLKRILLAFFILVKTDMGDKPISI